jgi:hypothetical protein
MKNAFLMFSDFIITTCNILKARVAKRGLLAKSNHTLAHPSKSEFVEKAKKMKSLLFRQFIYINLGIEGEVCKPPPFACKNA